jgi:hypothetical protein|tara:strand:+ start:73 stop:549 length:477 start_codon:yes stop_codon:yes gene_type:complete
VKIYKNFLKKEVFCFLKEQMISYNFPWYFNKKNKEDLSIYNRQFCHIFFNNYKVNSDYFHLLQPILDILNPKSLIRIKANMNLPTENMYENLPPHVDFDFSCKTAIFYLNSNNGYTCIEGTKINSEENKMVIFNSQTKHYGTNCTDKPYRVVINLNYF